MDESIKGVDKTFEGVDKILENDNNFNKYIKFLKRSYRPDTSNIENAKLLLRWMGVPVIDAPGEADSQCAAIAHFYTSNVIGVISDDSDLLMYGAPNVLKIGGLCTNTVDHYTLVDTLENISIKMQHVINKSSDPYIKCRYQNKKIALNHTHLIEIGCMLGTDYCSSGIHIRNNKNKINLIFELYAKHDMSIAKVLESISVSPTRISRILASKDLYINTMVFNPKYIDIKMKPPSIEMINSICSKFISKYDIGITIKMLINTYRLKMCNFKESHNIPNNSDYVNDRRSGIWNSAYRNYDKNNRVRAQCDSNTMRCPDALYRNPIITGY